MGEKGGLDRPVFRDRGFTTHLPCVWWWLRWSFNGRSAGTAGAVFLLLLEFIYRHHTRAAAVCGLPVNVNIPRSNPQ